MSTPRVLTTRELNRTLLERQLLLRRAELPAVTAVERLVGLQAQDPQPPYLALWSRLEAFDPQALATALTERSVVRTWVMRFTIHLVTAEDCLAIRPVVQPVLAQNLLNNYRRNLDGIDLEELADRGRALLDERPHSNREVGRRLAERWPDHDPHALGNAVRAIVPAIQVTPRGVWGASGPAKHTTVERWLGQPVSDDTRPDALVRRYLGAFGPATPADVRTWSGLAGIAEVLDRLRPRLRRFRDEAGHELFDLPDAPLADPEVPAPPRLLPRFDNVLLSHDDRSRIIDPVYRSVLASKNGMPPPAFLVGGRVAGTWRIDGKGAGARLLLRPFEPLNDPDTDALVAEATGMLRLVTGDDSADAVHLEAPAALTPPAGRRSGTRRSGS